MRIVFEKGVARVPQDSTILRFISMQQHGPKRIYTPQSLEFWFEKLEFDWERFFSATQLEAGRDIYRKSEIRELELTAKDAIIHRRIEKRDEYAVIEWENGTLNVRSSTTDTDLARAIAVAGLHEIEELVGDEIPPIFDEEAISAATNSETPTPAPKPNGTSEVKSAVSTQNRLLLLSFVTQIDGLAFQAFWLDENGGRTPALGQQPTANGNGQQNAGTTPTPSVSSAERTKLIGLAAYARKAHFAYDQKTGVYLLANIAEIPNFLKTTLPAWKRLFEIQLDAHAEKLTRGPQSIDIEAVASSASPRSANGKRSAGKAANNGASGTNTNGAGHQSDFALDLRWIFRTGERLLTDEEIDLVTKRGSSPTLIPDIGIVTLPADRIETLKSWQRNLAETQAADGSLPPYLVFSLFNDNTLKFTLTPEIEAWRKGVLDAQAPALSTAALPEILRPYQRRGVEWMYHLSDAGCHGLLADEMGLGKTLQVISLLGARPASNGQPTLIVCPASVVPVWQEEFARFSPSTRVEVLKSNNSFDSQPAANVVWVSSYAQLRKHRTALDSIEFGYTILDEGQFIKNPDAKTTHACFAIRTAHRIVLSGTPLENRQLDLWSIFRFLLPGLLGTRSGFEAALTADRDGTMTRLRTQLAPFILRRTKSEVAAELPAKIEMELLCPLTDVQRTEYARICAEGLERLGDDMEAARRENSFKFLSLLTRLRQVCCDPDMLPWLKSPLADSGKINLLVEKMAEIIGNGHKVVIFSQFVMFLDRVREALGQAFPELPLFEITGMTTDRQKPVQSFQTAKGPAAMLVSLKAGGTGITLHAADYIFLLDPWWNPAVEAQAVDRVHRIGQASTVFVYRMVTGGTIEERIQALKETKRGLFDKIVGELEGDVDLNNHFKSLHELVQLTTAEVVESEPVELAFI